MFQVTRIQSLITSFILKRTSFVVSFYNLIFKNSSIIDCIIMLTSYF
nr:MAG TPA: hypothetical protein [Caudoviricetes sp.]